MTTIGAARERLRRKRGENNEIKEIEERARSRETRARECRASEKKRARERERNVVLQERRAGRHVVKYGFTADTYRDVYIMFYPG